MRIVSSRMLTRMNKKKFINLKSSYSKMKREESGSNCTCLKKRSASTCWSSKGLEMKSLPSIVEFTEAKLLRYSTTDI